MIMEILPPSGAGFTVTMVGQVVGKAVLPLGEALVIDGQTIEYAKARYRLTWAGWQLDTVTLSNSRDGFLAQYSTSLADVDRGLTDMPTVVATWAQTFNPGNFEALPSEPGAAAEVAYHRGQAAAMTHLAALTEADRRRQS